MPTQTCQPSLGFGGPGTLELAVCGGDLSTGNNAEVHLSGAAPGAPAFLGIASSSLPTPLFGGTLLPVPTDFLLPLTVDASGQATLPNIPGGHGPFSLVVQAVALDLSLPNLIAISNGVEIHFLP